MTKHSSRYLPWLGLLIGMLAASEAHSKHPRTSPEIRHLEGLSLAELDALYAEGGIEHLPVGAARGKVLVFVDAKFPKVKARLSNTLWKGKHFDEDGEFINQFLGFKALKSKAEICTSWFDGKPTIQLEYPPKTPVFGDTHDEIREIGLGLFLGRVYDKTPCPKFRGYFVLQTECTR
jgi:hypothetical protein